MALCRFCGNGNLAVALAGVGPREAPAAPTGPPPLLPPMLAIEPAVPRFGTLPLAPPPLLPKPELVPALAGEPPDGSVTPEPAPWPLQPAPGSRVKPSRTRGESQCGRTVRCCTCWR